MITSVTSFLRRNSNPHKSSEAGLRKLKHNIEQKQKELDLKYPQQNTNLFSASSSLANKNSTVKQDPTYTVNLGVFEGQPDFCTSIPDYKDNYDKVRPDCHSVFTSIETPDAELITQMALGFYLHKQSDLALDSARSCFNDKMDDFAQNTAPGQGGLGDLVALKEISVMAPPYNKTSSCHSINIVDTHNNFNPIVMYFCGTTLMNVSVRFLDSTVRTAAIAAFDAASQCYNARKNLNIILGTTLSIGPAILLLSCLRVWPKDGGKINTYQAIYYGTSSCFKKLFDKRTEENRSINMHQNPPSYDSL